MMQSLLVASLTVVALLSTVGYSRDISFTCGNFSRFLQMQDCAITGARLLMLGTTFFSFLWFLSKSKFLKKLWLFFVVILFPVALLLLLYFFHSNLYGLISGVIVFAVLSLIIVYLDRFGKNLTKNHLAE